MVDKDLTSLSQEIDFSRTSHAAIREDTRVIKADRKHPWRAEGLVATWRSAVAFPHRRPGLLVQYGAQDLIRATSSGRDAENRIIFIHHEVFVSSFPSKFAVGAHMPQAVLLVTGAHPVFGAVWKCHDSGPARFGLWPSPARVLLYAIAIVGLPGIVAAAGGSRDNDS